MTKVVALMSMSLDGYVADLEDGVDEVFDWYFAGDVDVPTVKPEFTFHVSAASAEHVRALMGEVGAMLTGRRTSDRADAWGGQHPFGVPAFVVTHQVPEGWTRSDSTVHFVTDGLESAVAQAKAAAGDKIVGMHGADTIRQCLDAGLLDEIRVDLVPLLLGSGIRLFDRLGNAPFTLGNPTVVEGVGVTHLNYPVLKQ
ncbi:dihydrofolate reductase family protein [Arthrobacter sp. AZCC_0090]|uniref:dihydrofolate reductase family protein n=1 Tax=Arthrobacter sp. AZCC_0090 TaxID=2735881 RepID=UPI00161E374F|nr:dihydrofolate reductase family protein [Arthrobacter sp. AZCC_0090]MBB6407062.1 dihydrofolate reductase [Arthrobacter sp. AZCC_0090]